MADIWKRAKVFASVIALLAAPVWPRVLLASEWKIETIDQSGVGRYSSLKIDALGNAHVAYVVDDERHSLKYAFWDHSLKRWFTMKVADQASFSSLILDSKDRPHISYVDYGTGVGAKVEHAYWDGKSWKVQPVPLDPSVIAYYSSIALNSEDYPTISFYDYADPGGFILRLRTVTWNGKYWEVRTVDPEGGSGKFNAIAMNSAGRPEVAYANVKAEHMGLRYARWNGHSWDVEVLDGIGAVLAVYSVNMLLDKQDVPHIAYTDVQNDLVKYATQRNGKWELQVVDTLSNHAYPDRNGIALDDHGTPYISYYDAGTGRLKVATPKNGRWTAEVVDQGFSGVTSSIAIDHGNLWITYADESGAAIKCARTELNQAPATGALTSDHHRNGN